MEEEQYIQKLLTEIDDTLLEESRVRSKLRRTILELRKTLKL